VGYTVDVSLSPLGGWLRAQIASFEPRTRKHLLLYPRYGGEEWLDMECVVAVRVVDATAGAPLQPPEPACAPAPPRRAVVAAAASGGGAVAPDDQLDAVLDEVLSVLPVDVVWSDLQSVIEGL
jgi:hypothetical protein